MCAEGTATAEPKNYRPLPDYDALVARWLGNYDKSNYDRGLSAAVLRNTHALVERPFGPDVMFPQVLEVGAGTLAHLPFVRHRFERYIASDFDQSVLDAVKDAPHPKGVELLKLDGSSLPFQDNSFNRLIATHVLEHVPFPHLAIQEWVRVLKPGGVLSLILPCDPGWAWRLGRYLGPRKHAEKAGLPYDYYMAREHINSIFNLDQLLKYHFPKRDVIWWPMRLPFPDINLIYTGNFYV
ncbi:MAG: class I SAM-dependent methyltransferase [Mesorhizobium sp.]|nr:MAG: class I SAM-dependent methyltransferase [Mesorhizobium sp.]